MNKKYPRKKGRKQGRKGKYYLWIQKDGLTKLEGWARDGLVDEQIANNVGIHVATLYEWKKRFTEIDDALKRGKEVIDMEVENAMLQRALGYEFEEVKTIVEDTDGKTKKKIEKIQKHIPADVTAQIFWLKNRKPEHWRDRREHEHSGNIDSSVDLTGFSEQELRKLADNFKPE